MGDYKALFHIVDDALLKDGDLQHIIVLKDLAGYPEHPVIESHGGDTPAAAVPPVVHLSGGLKNMSSPDRNATRKTGHTTSPLGLGLMITTSGKISSQGFPGLDDLSYGFIFLHDLTCSLFVMFLGRIPFVRGPD